MKGLSDGSLRFVQTQMYLSCSSNFFSDNREKKKGMANKNKNKIKKGIDFSSPKVQKWFHRRPARNYPIIPFCSISIFAAEVAGLSRGALGTGIQLCWQNTLLRIETLECDLLDVVSSRECWMNLRVASALSLLNQGARQSHSWSYLMSVVENLGEVRTDPEKSLVK